MQKKIEEYIRKWKMLEAGDHVIAGVSGGADSVCLFVLLAELRRQYGFTMTAVHVNHNIRGEEAEADERYVVSLCDRYQVECKVYHMDVPALAAHERLSEEEAGRLARREAFEETLRECGGTKIALAHHQDDNAETFFMNVARGSKLRGLGGICPVNGRYIRPLLCVTRKEIECFLLEKGIHYCIDATNQSEEYMRNRIRNRVIPYFEKNINCQTVAHINGTMEQLRLIQAYLEKQADAAYERCVTVRKREEDGTACEIRVAHKELEQIEELLQPMVLYRALATAAGREKDLEEIHVVALQHLFGRQTGRRLHLPYDLEAVRTYEGIVIQRREERESTGQAEEKELLDGRQNGSVCFHGHCISWRIFPKSQSEGEIPKKAYTKWFDYDIIKHNAVVRTRRAGDRIIIDEKGRGKKLKAFFIDEKIPEAERSEILLIADGSQILWIAGYRQSKAYQVKRNTTTVLEIKIDGGISDGRKD